MLGTVGLLQPWPHPPVGTHLASSLLPPHCAHLPRSGTPPLPQRVPAMYPPAHRHGPTPSRPNSAGLAAWTQPTWLPAARVGPLSEPKLPKQPSTLLSARFSASARHLAPLRGSLVAPYILTPGSFSKPWGTQGSRTPHAHPRPAEARCACGLSPAPPHPGWRPQAQVASQKPRRPGVLAPRCPPAQAPAPASSSQQQRALLWLPATPTGALLSPLPYPPPLSLVAYPLLLVSWPEMTRPSS